MEGYTRDHLHLESTNPPGHPEPLSRERSGDNSEELLLDRGGRYSGSAEKFIRAMKGAAISLWAAREPRAHQKQRNIFLCLHRMPSLMRGLE